MELIKKKKVTHHIAKNDSESFNIFKLIRICVLLLSKGWLVVSSMVSENKRRREK